MYLHTRLLFGIGTVTLLALVVSIVVPLGSVRSDVGRETDASMELARLLLDVQSAVAGSPASGQAQQAAAQAIQRAPDIRHVRVSLVDGQGKLLASSPTDSPRPGRLTRALLSSRNLATLDYPLAYHSVAVGTLRVSSNPLSEFAEIQQRVGRDLALLTGAILALGAAIYSMVRRGLRPIAQVQAALASLQEGALRTRLPRFRLKDVDDISERFNRCAAAMELAAAQRRDLNRRIIETEEQERKRLARELHDELGQSLTAIKVDAAYIAREAHGTSDKIVDSARAIEKLSGEIMDLIRNMLARLRPHGLETVGLRETLEDLVSGWQARVADRFECSLSIDGDVDVLGSDLSVTLYRLVQECLTNAVRHSRARAISIRLSVNEVPMSGVTVDVTESNVTTTGTALAGGGAGLLGMRERVEAHGGELRIDTTTGSLSLHAWLPISAAEDATVAGAPMHA